MSLLNLELYLFAVLSNLPQDEVGACSLAMKGDEVRVERCDERWGKEAGDGCERVKVLVVVHPKVGAEEAKFMGDECVIGRPFD